MRIGIHMALIASGIGIVACFFYASDALTAERIRAEKSARIRNERQKYQFELITLGMSNREISELIGLPGMPSSKSEWSTVGTIQGCERGVKILEPSECGCRSFDHLWKIPPDRKLHWMQWRIEGELGYIAVGFIDRYSEQQDPTPVAVAKINGQSNQIEPLLTDGVGVMNHAAGRNAIGDR